MILLTFWNTTDLPGLLYSSGYRQKIYLDAEFNTPAIQAQEEPVQDGFGETRYTYAKLSLVTRFDAVNVSDDSLFALRMAKYHDNVYLKNLETGQEFQAISINMTEITQPNRLARVNFEAVMKQVTITGCGIDYQAIEC